MRAELRELRSRVAFLEPAQDERDRLRRDLTDLRAARVVELSEHSQQVESAGVDFDDSQALRAELGALRALVSRHEATVGIQAATINRLHSQLDSESSSATPTPDLRAAEAVLARRVKLDDLTVVVGIDRESAALCHQQGISTWWALANTDVRALRAMLAQAGRDAREHDPRSWPQQARLLANGSWQQFVDLTR